MVCIYCGSETKVTNSRHQKRMNQVWRRRQCLVCKAIFTTIEGVDTAQALRVRYGKRLEAFSRDKLLMSVYDSMKHRKTAVTDSTALTNTIMGQLYPLVVDATIERDSIAELAFAVIERFDNAAATSYRAFHPVE